MRIGINLLYLLPGVVGGTETYAAGLIKGLSQIECNSEFIIFVNRESCDWPLPQARNIERIICPILASCRPRRYFYEQVIFPQLLKKYSIDVVHSLGYVGPLYSPCPAVVTVPDLNYIAMKKIWNSLNYNPIVKSLKRYPYGFFSKMTTKRADVVITISNYSKKMICSELMISPEKIIVTYLGPRYSKDKEASNIRNKINEIYGITTPYLIAFGGGRIHKNIPRLIQVFSKFKNEFPHKLVIIGKIPDNVNPVDLTNGIIATGYLPEDHILPLLSGAEMFILPSLYEGFGLPVIEAQQAGVPVVCSTAGSLPEVAGEGAIYFDPYSVEDMTNKIVRVTNDTKLRIDLRMKGLANIKRFSWEKTARETLQVYYKALAMN